MFAWIVLLISVALAGVDVNSADSAALESLPGIGPSKAAAIIAYREANGPFKSLDDLDRVEGIGPSTLANLQELVSFGNAAIPAGASSSTPAASSPASNASASTPTVASGAAPAKATSSAGCPININSADANVLEGLPGIGASKAAAIVQYRTDNGAFSSCDGLDGVSGIGSATLAGLRDCCVVK